MQKDREYMQKLKCTVSYDGTNYSGFQIQQNANTIQAEIEKVLLKIHKNKLVQIHGSGRTDKGVHAMAQVFHFETTIQMEVYNWRKAMNALLPKDISIEVIEEVPEDFHARLMAKQKEYRYYVLNTKDRNVFKRNFTHHEFGELNIHTMQEVCELFVGTHDFTSFSSTKSTVKGTKVRTLYEVSCTKEDDEIEFILRGDGFLYNMVRIIVGVLIDVGLGRRTFAEVEAMFAKMDRGAVGVTLPPQALFLWEVIY